MPVCHKHAGLAFPSRVIQPCYVILVRSLGNRHERSHRNSTSGVKVRKLEDKSHYETLGVSPNVSQEQLKSAFYDLSKTLHPDKSASSSAIDEFKAVNEAYSVLSNEKSRKLYDQQLRLNENPVAGQQFKMRQQYRYTGQSFIKGGCGRGIRNKVQIPLCRHRLHCNFGKIK